MLVPAHTYRLPQSRPSPQNTRKLQFRQPIQRPFNAHEHTQTLTRRSYRLTHTGCPHPVHPSYHPEITVQTNPQRSRTLVNTGKLKSNSRKRSCNTNPNAPGLSDSPTPEYPIWPRRLTFPTSRKYTHLHAAADSRQHPLPPGTRSAGSTSQFPMSRIQRPLATGY